MAKTELTKEIERALYFYTESNKAGTYGCFEACLGLGYGDEYVDFLTMDSKNVFRAYEIKVTFSDLKSKAKKSFVGDYNYFVIPAKLWENDDVKMYIRTNYWRIGVIVYDEVTYANGYCSKGLHSVRKCVKMSIGIGERVSLMHYMVRSLSRNTTKLLQNKEENKC